MKKECETCKTSSRGTPCPDNRFGACLGKGAYDFNYNKWQPKEEVMEKSYCKDCKYFDGHYDTKCKKGVYSDMSENPCDDFKSKEEAKMKETFNLIDILEDEACIAGVKWLIEKANNNITFLTKNIVQMAKEDGKTEYIKWLKRYGYYKDNSDKIAELESKMADIQKEIDKLKE